jgi:hypothetical protein
VIAGVGHAAPAEGLVIAGVGHAAPVEGLVIAGVGQAPPTRGPVIASVAHAPPAVGLGITGRKPLLPRAKRLHACGELAVDAVRS